MKKLDLYIIKKFLTVFSFSFILFIVVSVVIDISEKINLFVISGLSVWEIIKQYHFGFVPYITVVLFPILVFITVVMFTSRMAMNSEIIAIRASGVSYNRFLFPFLLCGVFLMVVHWGMHNYVLPKANKIRIAFEEINKQKDPAYLKSLYLRSDDSTFVIFKNYSSLSAQSSPFFVDIIAESRLKQRIAGDRIVWYAPTQTWKASKVDIKTYNYDGEILSTNYQDTMAITFSFTPEDAILDERLPEKLMRNELSHFIEKEKKKGKNVTFLSLLYHKNDSTPLLIFILVFIAVMLSSKRIRGGTGLHIALGSILMAIYIFLDRISGVFALKGSLSPLFAAWLPHILFAIVAYFIYIKNKESAV